MSNQFHPVMAGKDEDQLSEVLLNRMDYLPDAVLAAREELGNRGLSLQEMEVLEAEGLALQAAAEARAELPLSGWEKQLYFLFSFLLFTPIAAFFYRRYLEVGEDKRGWDSMAMVLLGNLFYFALYSVLSRMGLIS
jgi:hypothetical protein